MEIFPVSPLPAFQRAFNTNVHVSKYDSGARQAFSAYKKPLMTWNFAFQNFNEVKANTLTSFAQDMFGPRDSFLFKDPYLKYINSVLLCSTNQTNGSTLQTFDVKSFSVRIDTLDIATITSNASGFVTLGAEFNYDQDSGILTINTIAAGDFWSLTNTVEYFRKVAFQKDYSDASNIWNIYNATIVIEEMP